MRAGFRDVSATMIARAAVLVSGLALQSCLAWYLEPAGRGSYTVCMIYTTLLSVICMFGVDGGGQYFVAAKKFTLSQGVSVLLVLQSIGILVAVSGGLAAMWLPLEFFQKSTTPAFVLAVLCVPWQMAMTSLLLIVAAVREFRFHAIVSSVQAILRLAATFVMIRLIRLGVPGAMGAFMLSMLIIVVWILLFLVRRHGLHWVRPKIEDVKQVLHYSARYYPAAFSTLVNLQIGTIMVAFFTSQEEIGYFGVGVTLTTYIVIVSDVVGGVIHPRIAGDPTGRPELAAQSCRLIGALSFVVLFVLTVFANPIVDMLFSPKFSPIVPLIWILAPGALYRASTKVLGHYMNAINHPGVCSAATLVSMTTNLVLLLLLLPMMGLPGAAWAMSIAYFSGGTVLLVAFWRISGLPLGKTWLPQRADLALVSGIASRIQQGMVSFGKRG